MEVMLDTNAISVSAAVDAALPLLRQFRPDIRASSGSCPSRN
jgi:hypothetical protein